jgi:formamidopyrimidine-DNA glycosylase
MPELPEVQTVVTRLDEVVRGARVTSVRLLRRDVVRHGARDLDRRLRGRTVRRVDRHGKQILWRFDGDTELRVHLGMTGNLVLAVPDAPLAPHTHVRIRFSGLDREVRFRDPRRFGGLWLADAGASAGRFSSPLGPDALAIDLRGFRELLTRRRRIKALLLDQTAIAGLGNIYVDESLHRARIHPLRLAADLADDRIRALRRSMRRVLREAIAAGGSSLRDYRGADEEPGWFQVAHRVYGRAGEPCTTCRTPIERIVLATRATHLCPHCQPAP